MSVLFGRTFFYSFLFSFTRASFSRMLFCTLIFSILNRVRFDRRASFDGTAMDRFIASTTHPTAPVQRTRSFRIANGAALLLRWSQDPISWSCCLPNGMSACTPYIFNVMKCASTSGFTPLDSIKSAQSNQLRRPLFCTAL